MKSTTRLIESTGTVIPSRLVEVAPLSRTQNKRRSDALTFFECTGSSNGLTETINRRLEHPRGRESSFFARPTTVLPASSRGFAVQSYPKLGQEEGVYTGMLR